MFDKIQIVGKSYSLIEEWSAFVSSLVFSPRFILQEALNLKFDVRQRMFLQEIASLKESTARHWLSRGKVPIGSVFRDLMKKFSGEGCSVLPVSSTEFIRGLKDPVWGDFAGNWIRDDDNLFGQTMWAIATNQFENQKSNRDLDLRRLGSCLPAELLDSLKKEWPQTSRREDLLDDIIEVFAAIYFLTVAESEYFAEICQDDLFIEKILPRYIDREKRTVSLPSELFFKTLLERMIGISLYQDKKDVAGAIEDVMNLDRVEHAMRDINYCLNSQDQKPLGWTRFNKWISYFVGDYIIKQRHVNPAEIEEEKQAREKEEELEKCRSLNYAQNLFGAVRILNLVFLVSNKTISKAGLDPVDFFHDGYSACIKLQRE